MGGYFCIHFIDHKVGKTVCRVSQTCEKVEPFHGLQQKDDSRDKYCPVTPVPGNEQDNTCGGEQQQDIACRKKRGIQRREYDEQHHPPEEPAAEVLAYTFPVVPLYVESESEKQRENSVSFTGKQ